MVKPNAILQRSAIGAVLLASLAAPLLCAQSNNDLPAGPMQEKATTACTECHEARIVVQQRLSKAAWTKEVDKTTKWGALVEPQDREALIDYLSANFGVDKAPYEAERTRIPASKKK